MNTRFRIPTALLAMVLLGITVGRPASTQAIAKERDVAMDTGKQPAAEKRAYTVENCVREFSEDAVTKTARGWEFWFVPTDLSPTFNFKMSYVGPRSANHPPHTHPEEEIYYIFEGKAEFSLDGKTKVVGPNSTMFCPSGIPHGIRNMGDSPLRYAVIKANYPAGK